MTNRNAATIPTWTLGERLEKAREFAGLTTHEMAARLGVSERTIRNWEHRERGITRAQVISYSTITQVPMWWFDGIEPEEGTQSATTWYAGALKLEVA